jgi:hypothetical protein
MKVRWRGDCCYRFETGFRDTGLFAESSRALYKIAQLSVTICGRIRQALEEHPKRLRMAAMDERMGQGFTGTPSFS